MKSWLIVLALAGASVASAKSYSVTFPEPFAVGTTAVKAGSYKLDLEGSKVLLLDRRGRTAAEAGVKVETGQKKYGQTFIESKTVGDGQRITAIDLAGTRMKLVLN